ncbi:suppressor of tumorigenicity 14 protein homolog [Culicoides brevitarsis]|uniref:suppressor of tumorigenicity 14 protein homolog n=1 Tax=Culicoides brevitarsis TaxID=469753 RepID=UPI00307C6858
MQIILILLIFDVVTCKFVCKSGDDLEVSKVCNGKADCLDGSDERKELCTMSLCDIKEFKCFYGACISRHLLCNGAKDCVDGSDESQCGLSSTSCEKNQFRCDSGECINSTSICDGIKNCIDTSDESPKICEHELCPANTFRCRYGSCIHLNSTCNGFNDCIDGSDEALDLCSHKNENGFWSRDILKCEPECGRTNTISPLIVKSMETKAPFPWHATMYVHKNGNYTFWCGATLISEALFVTAAHCTYKLSADVIKLYLGKTKKTFDVTSEEPEATVYQVKRVIEHPLYLDQNGNYASDIALLEITEEVQFSENRLPVCIDWELDDITEHLSENNLGVVMGMGVTENDTFSESLRFAWLPVIPNEKCIDKHKVDFKKYVTVTSFCAGWANGTGVCNGDSGGGLAFPIKGVQRWCLEGIVSLSPRRQTSSFCDPNEYTIFTKVGMYVKWIEHVMEEVHATHNFTRKKYEPILKGN